MYDVNNNFAQSRSGSNNCVADTPEVVPVATWLPIERRDEDLSPILRGNVPDLEKMKTWKPPLAERIGG